jgi:hypothetical protein
MRLYDMHPNLYSTTPYSMLRNMVKDDKARANLMQKTLHILRKHVLRTKQERVTLLYLPWKIQQT